MIDKETLEQMIRRAKEAARNAYAPYSGYSVGAALLSGDGRIFSGCNVENASYGLTMCAERSAVFAARCSGASQFKAIVIYAPQSPPPMPCGACRQVLAEGNSNPIVFVVSGDSPAREFDLQSLLPYSFSLK